MIRIERMAMPMEMYMCSMCMRFDAKNSMVSQKNS